MTVHIIRLRRLVPLVALAIAALGASVIAGQSHDGKPERFTALAINFDAPPGATSTTVDITVDRWSTDAERDRLMALLMEKGPAALLDTLRNLPKVGTIRTPDSIGYDLRFARKVPMPDRGERIAIVTDRPIGFWEASAQPRTMDYPFTVIEMHINPDGKGEGKLSIGTKIQVDKDTGTIVLENYSTQPVQLSAVRRLD
jgi:hypothetical protein